MGGVGHALAVTAVLGLHPAVHRVLHVEHGAGVGAATHGVERQPQGVGDGVGQATVGAGGDVQQVEAAVEQEGVEAFGVGAARLAGQGVVVIEGEAGLLVGLEHAPGEQGAHVELAGPGLLQHRQGQLMAQFRQGQALGFGHEVALVLQG